jgi:hypothetical protein
MSKATNARFPLAFCLGLVLSCVLVTPLAPIVFVGLWALWRLALRLCAKTPVSPREKKIAWE